MPLETEQKIMGRDSNDIPLQAVIPDAKEISSPMVFPIYKNQKNKNDK